MPCVPLAIRRGFISVSRANAFGVSGRGNGPKCRQDPPGSTEISRPKVESRGR